LIVAGMWLKRILIVVPAVSNPLIAGAWGSFHPTWIAVAITVGAAAGVPLLLMFFFKFFPILAIYEMGELHAEEAQDSRSVKLLVGNPVEGGRVS
jgi:molybdopterin-containing oxidoreductase family membrane subunit